MVKKIVKGVILAVGLLFIYTPILLLVVFSFTPATTLGVWEGFSFDLYVQLVGNAQIMNIVKDTVILAVLAAAVSTVLGTLGAIGIFYSKKKMANAVSAVSRIPVINAEVVTAMSLTLLFVEIYLDRYFGNGLIAIRPDLNETVGKDTKRFLSDMVKAACQGGSKLFKTFQEQKDWLEIMGVPYVGNLNRILQQEGAGRLIKLSEALQEKKIASIADAVAKKADCRIVLISGPSSSGKTTFCKRLSIQLQVLGYSTAEISLDDYFVDREKTPRDANGDYDFECLEAIDREFFNQQLQQILNVQKETEIKMPVYDFKVGVRRMDKKIRVSPKTIVLVEGIHGLNPALTDLDSRFTFKIFVSALTHISIDTQNPVSSTDNRLIRRMVRDSKFRGNSALATLDRWPSVRRGENKNIFPYQEQADVMFNSALLFELGVLKQDAEALLRAIPENSEHYGEAHRLLKFLSYFLPIEEKEIPPTSILREFLGGSSFVY